MSIHRLLSCGKGPAFLSFALLSLLLAPGCADKRGGSVPYDMTLGRPDAPTVLAAVDDKLAPLDTVTVSVFRVPDLSRDYTIDLAGDLSMPLIGKIKAVGLTSDQLATAITTSLGQRYLQNPNVTVGLKDSQRRTVTVEGSVRDPGIFPAAGPMTLLQVVATAKGLDGDANPHRVVVFRTIDGKRLAAAFDLVSIRRSEAQDPEIYAGDVVVVDGSSLSRTRREVLQGIPVLSVFAAIL